MRRRDFIAGAMGSVVPSFARPVSAQSNVSRLWRVAFISSGIAGEQVDIFREVLHQLGYEVGKNLVLDVREARGNYGLLPDLTAEVVSQKPDVIVAEATPAITAAKRATSNIPIVMAPATDPIGSGFVQSLAHPGGNITGVANLFGDQTAKVLDFLHLVLPQAKKIGVLISNNPTHSALFEAAKRGASSIGISAQPFMGQSPTTLKLRSLQYNLPTVKPCTSWPILFARRSLNWL